MAWEFDADNNEYVELVDASKITIPNSDYFTIGFWMNISASVDDFQYVYSGGGGFSDNDTFHFLLIDDGGASDKKWRIKMTNSAAAGDDQTGATAATYGSWVHTVISYNDSTGAMMVHEDNTEIMNNTFNMAGADPQIHTIIGTRGEATPHASRHVEGHLAEFFYINGTQITSGDRDMLAAGFSPLFLPYDLDIYTPMIREYTDYADAPLTVNNNGTAVVEHPPIIYPWGAALGHAATAAGPGPSGPPAGSLALLGVGT